MTEEIYPMPFFARLLVHDLEASSKFYQDTLGFKHIFTMPGPRNKPPLVHLRWSKYADLLIALPQDGQEVPEPRGVGVALSFQMLDRFEGSVDMLAKQAKERREHRVWPSGPALERARDGRPRPGWLSTGFYSPAQY